MAITLIKQGKMYRVKASCALLGDIGVLSPGEIFLVIAVKYDAYSPKGKKASGLVSLLSPLGRLAEDIRFAQRDFDMYFERVVN